MKKPTTTEKIIGIVMIVVGLIILFFIAPAVFKTIYSGLSLLSQAPSVGGLIGFLVTIVFGPGIIVFVVVGLMLIGGNLIRGDKK